jgi:hypothetical protein
MLFINQGEEVDRVVGANTATTYTSKIEALLENDS